MRSRLPLFPRDLGERPASCIVKLTSPNLTSPCADSHLLLSFFPRYFTAEEDTVARFCSILSCCAYFSVTSCRFLPLFPSALTFAALLLLNNRDILASLFFRAPFVIFFTNNILIHFISIFLFSFFFPLFSSPWRGRVSFLFILNNSILFSLTLDIPLLELFCLEQNYFNPHLFVR